MVSSLQLAAKASGTKIPPPKPRSDTTTSYTIGGSSSSNSSNRRHSGNYEVPIREQQFTYEIAKTGNETAMDEDPPAHGSTKSYRRPSPTLHQYSVPITAFGPAATNTRKSTSSPPTVVQTSYTIGSTDESQPSSAIEKMEGVEDQGYKPPMVVLDGANVAHAYAGALSGVQLKNGKPEPDSTGIRVVVDYFEAAGVRTLVVLPQYWFRSKPKPGDLQWNAKMETPQLEVLNGLKEKGLIVSSPPTDDDDAYALTISRREETRSLRRKGEGPGFVLSNDMFRDAQARDTTGALKHWLTKGRNDTIGPGRISYSFADMGTMNDHGERILDFVPNPRHPLVIWMEGMQLQGGSQ